MLFPSTRILRCSNISENRGVEQNEKLNRNGVVIPLLLVLPVDM